MRTAFIRALEEVAGEDDRVMLVVGDLGFGVVEPFAQRFPLRYLNAGVAEQNMTGIAAGMALSGNVVFTYSIGNFPTMRCLEQVRNDVCYHRANVKIVAVGGGFVYGSLGMTHHATEDIAIMRALPNMTVIAPGDPVEAAAATRAVVHWPGPCYLRLGRAGEPVVHPSTIDFRIGKAIKVRDGEDLTLISTGGMLAAAVEVAGQLLERGVRTRVLSMHTVKPLDTEAVLAAARETGAIATIEEHSILGGLGSAVAEVLAECDERKVPFTRIGLESAFAPTAGDQAYLRKTFGLSREAVVERLLTLIDPVTHSRRTGGL
ncbi:MAG: transketolase subunit [Dehalococcoidia bacterium]|nr:transketolase subunit [Dehalococcoidia bacterium]